ncbi:carbohydrate ABC transporter permease [Pseudactinotalea sp.]|uniref:carbohydrate ABC transporter permease n=1 Tax=Pseudactinotalea sp. TaxID=1926260 RepID=UPI003B3BA227
MGKPSVFATIARAVVLILCCAAVLVPFLAVVSTSVASPAQLTSAGGFVLWPEEPSLTAFRAVLSGGVVTRAMLVSIGVTGVGTLASVAVTVGLAYALSRPGSLFHKPLLLGTLFTLFFNPGIIPTYMVVRQLGLIDSFAALVLPVLVSGFNVVVMRAFFLEIPQELLESARIDGASEARTLRSIVLPLSKAVIAVIGLFYAVMYWNAFFTALLYINSTEKWPLQLIVRTFVVNQTPLAADDLDLAGEVVPPQLSVQMAILVLAIIPILVVYPFIQKHFTKGLLIGAVKG